MESTRYLGRNADNDHVYVTIRLTRDDQTRKTIFHNNVNDVVSLNITGFVIDGTITDQRANTRSPEEFHDRYWLGCGQCIDSLPNTDLGNEISKLWARWHLNTMNAACAHQNKHLYGPNVYPQPDWTERANAETRRCPHGYRYGSAWLTEQIPTTTLHRLCEIAGLNPTDI